MSKSLASILTACFVLVATQAAVPDSRGERTDNPYDTSLSRSGRTIRIPATILNNVINVFVSFILDVIYALRNIEYDVYYLLGRMVPGPVGRFLLNFSGYPANSA